MDFNFKQNNPVVLFVCFMYSFLSDPFYNLMREMSTKSGGTETPRVMSLAYYCAAFF